jgi:hypothetical protein
MTFRIDFVSRVANADKTTWHFSIKGLYGKGIYCSLRTDEDGRGLSLLQDCPEQPVRLLSRDHFEIPPTATRWNARTRLTAALITLGWGPEVHDPPGER